MLDCAVGASQQLVPLPLLLPLQVLGELAAYAPPTASTRGQYVLRAEAWREFDPFYPHYTR